MLISFVSQNYIVNNEKTAASFNKKINNKREKFRNEINIIKEISFNLFHKFQVNNIHKNYKQFKSATTVEFSGAKKRNQAYPISKDPAGYHQVNIQIIQNVLLIWLDNNIDENNEVYYSCKPNDTINFMLLHYKEPSCN